MSSYRNDNDAGYDRTLLSSVPDPTRAEKQEGYNVDLLDDGRDRRGTTPSNELAATATSDHQHGGPTVGYSPGAVSYARKEEGVASNGLEPVTPKVPWYRTRRGVIFIVIGAVLIIAAIVGGAVGGTHHSSHHTTPSNASSSVSGNNSATGVQGTGNVTQQSQQSVGAGPGLNTVSPSPSASAKRSFLAEIML
jgi:hypothetical protein